MNPPAISPLARGRILCLVTAALWSTSGAFVKNLGMPPVTVAMYRALFAGTALLLYLLLRRRKVSFDWRMLGMLACFASMNYLFIASMTHTTAANTIFLQYTAPFWMFLASVLLLGEPVDRLSLVALLGALFGIGIILVGNWEGEGIHRLGILLGLGSGFCYAGVAVFLRLLREHDAVWLATVNLLGAGIILGFSSALWQAFGASDSGGFPVPAEDKLLWLALFGISQMAIPYVLFGYGMREVGPQEAGILTLVEPVLVPLWTFLSVNERPSAATVVGGALLIAMVLVRYVPGLFTRSS